MQKYHSLLIERIVSFYIDRLKPNRGIYVPRKDHVDNEALTSLDIRMKLPYREPVLGSTEMHTIEHLTATWLRNNPEWKNKIIYWEPTDCMTGNCLIIAGDYSAEDITPLITQLLEYITNFKGEIPGASALEYDSFCNNNPSVAKYEARKYLEETLYKLAIENLHYPED